jgi:hypothetical protein
MPQITEIMGLFELIKVLNLMMEDEIFSNQHGDITVVLE